MSTEDFKILVDDLNDNKRKYAVRISYKDIGLFQGKGYTSIGASQVAAEFLTNPKFPAEVRDNIQVRYWKE